MLKIKQRLFQQTLGKIQIINKKKIKLQIKHFWEE